MEHDLKASSKQPSVAFHEIWLRLQEQLDILDKNNAILYEIGNKFIDDSGDINKQLKEEQPAKPGLVRDLNGCIDKMKDLNTFYGKQLSKLQTII